VFADEQTQRNDRNPVPRRRHVRLTGNEPEVPVAEEALVHEVTLNLNDDSGWVNSLQ
jgi:hypothetical protein